MSSALIKDFLKSSVSILQVVRPVNTQCGELPDWGLGVWLKLLISHLPWSFLGCSHQHSHCVPKNLSSELYKKIFSLKGWANVRIKTTHSRDGVGKGQVRRGSCLQLSICSKKPFLISLRDRRERVNATGKHGKHLERFCYSGSST